MSMKYLDHLLPISPSPFLLFLTSKNPHILCFCHSFKGLDYVYKREHSIFVLVWLIWHIVICIALLSFAK
jgi:hypothetical protein